MRARGGVGGQVLERGEELDVDEVQQLLAGDALGVGGPFAPLQVLGDGREVIVLEQFEFLVLVVDNLEKEHPAKLADALGVTVDAGVLAHDVLDGFNEGADRHGSGRVLVEFGLQVVDGLLEAGFAAKGAHQFDGRAERIQWRDSKHVDVVEVQDTFVGVFGQ